jgi:hypothetical protein
MFSIGNMSTSPQSKPDAHQIIRVFLCGNVMTGRGIDQILRIPVTPNDMRIGRNQLAIMSG